MDLQSQTDIALWQLAALGKSEDACVTLINRHRAIVWRVCSRLLLCHDDREEALQMTFVSLMEQGAQIQSKDFSPWLYRVAYRAAIRVRQQTMASLPDGIETGQMLSEHAAFECIESAERAEQIATAVDRLSGRHREVLILHYVKGMSREAIADLLGTTLQTVKGRLSRARMKLRRDLVSKGFTLAAVAAFLSDECVAAMPDEVSAALHQQLRAWQQGVPVGLARLHYSDLTGKEFGMNLGTFIVPRSWGTISSVLLIVAAFYVGQAQSVPGDGAFAAEDSNHVSGVLAEPDEGVGRRTQSVQFVSFSQKGQEEATEQINPDPKPVRTPIDGSLSSSPPGQPVIAERVDAPRSGTTLAPDQSAAPPGASAFTVPAPAPRPIVDSLGPSGPTSPAQPRTATFGVPATRPTSSLSAPRYTDIPASRVPVRVNSTRPVSGSSQRRGLPEGTWTRQTVWGTTTSSVSGNQIRLEIQATQLQGLELSIRAEYAVASDGTLYGLVHSVSSRMPAAVSPEASAELPLILNNLADIPFSLRCHTDQDSVSIKSIRIGSLAPELSKSGGDSSEIQTMIQLMVVGIYRLEQPNSTPSPYHQAR